MNELQVIEQVLQRAGRRRRWERAWDGLWLGLLLGSSGALLVLALYKLLPLPPLSLIAAGVFALTATLAGTLAGAWRKTSLEEMARWLDGRRHLEERVSTALEVAHAPATTQWRNLVVHDAAIQVREVDPRRMLPYHLPRTGHWVLLVFVAMAGLGFVPEYRSPAYRQRQQEQENVRATARTLAEVTKRQLVTRPPLLEPTQRSLESITNLATQLARNPLTRGEAVREVANAVEKLGRQLQDAAQNPAIKRMEQAAREPGGGADTSPGELQRKIEELEKSLGKAADQPGQIQKLKDDLLKARQKVEGLPDKDTVEGRAARDQMAQTLADLAQKARDLGQPMATLEDAIAALQTGNTDLFLRDLQAALTDLDKLNQMAQALKQLQQQAAQLGKNLAEQLKKGQVACAQQTLQKMIGQLQSGQLTPQQAQQILAEVKQAVGPAGEYGKTADHLARAVKHLGQGQRLESAQALGDAVKELEQMLKELNDAQALAAALESLKHAQMCMANCQGWSQCQNPNGRPGFGQGGKPGSGVGTWAEETGWLYYPQERSGLWDNSGIVRPDSDPRGHTERDASQPENLAPTKIRGQVAPGTAMPSITLKGVSIKGQSNVKYEEAAAAAQSEAQSALNQDQVPRAYRDSVRDYFNDLKK